MEEKRGRKVGRERNKKQEKKISSAYFQNESEWNEMKTFIQISFSKRFVFKHFYK